MRSSETKPPIWYMVKEAVEYLGGSTSNREVYDWICHKYPGTSRRAIYNQIVACSVNHSSRIYYSENRKLRVANGTHDFLFRRGRGQLELYEPTKHGIWRIVETEDGRLVVQQVVESNLPTDDDTRTGSDGICSRCMSPSVDESANRSSVECERNRTKSRSYEDDAAGKWPKLAEVGYASLMVVSYVAAYIFGVLVTAILFGLWGGISIPIALCADRIPPMWRPWVAYGASGWFAFLSCVAVGAAVYSAWRGESKHELMGRTVWKGFEYCFLVFVGVVLQYAGTYWVLDSLCPGQHFAEKGGPIDWLYFSVMTVATVGYGDIKPASWFARLLASVEVIEGILLLASFVGVLASLRSEEIRSGHAFFWRRFRKMRNAFRETEERFGRRSPELLCITWTMGAEVCRWLSEDLELREGFLNWLAGDEWAQLCRFGARTKSNEVIPFVAADSPLVEIIDEFGKSESWDSWRYSKDPKTFVTTPGGSLEVYETTLEGISTKQLVHMPVGCIPFGLDRIPFHVTDFTQPEPQEWRQSGYWTPIDFAEKILAYFERYLLHTCSTTTNPVFTFRFSQTSMAAKRPKGKLNEEVVEFLSKLGGLPGITPDEIAKAINIRDISKYNFTSRQSVARTRAYKDYKHNREKKNKLRKQQ